jgi:hypothetical protein
VFSEKKRRWSRAGRIPAIVKEAAASCVQGMLLQAMRALPDLAASVWLRTSTAMRGRCRAESTICTIQSSHVLPFSSTNLSSSLHHLVLFARSSAKFHVSTHRNCSIHVCIFSLFFFMFSEHSWFSLGPVWIHLWIFNKSASKNCWTKQFLLYLQI